MLQDVVLSPQALARGYFNPECVKRCVEEHLEGRRDRQKQLWTLLNFELWQRQIRA
jgi:asparagine synthase (glutamine-hydrolysing)